ncbi:MAG: glycosyltransferase family 2 protein [Thermodesulfovibrionales bacterium]
MKLEAQPLVTVLTPVYNGEKYLEECIESILAQTYQNWEYIIVNNCSTDGTLEIAKKYAKKDTRIHVHNNKHFLNLIQNHNHAFTLISSESRYCKVLQADDWLFPECIEKMVKVAEEHPSVSIVGSYRLDDVRVNCDGLPYPSTVVSGREICRSTLLKGLYVFGSPTTLLFRSEIIRNRNPFYNEKNLHADKEACFEILQDSDFGFVHEILSFTRRENEAMTTFARRVNSYILGDLIILKKYGPIYLSEDEFKQSLNISIKNYYRFLAKSIFKKKGKEFWKFHKNGLKELGIPMNFTRLFVSAIIALYNHLLDALKIH